jgi:predicted XRE-type DNA-binding protein/phage-related protein
VKDIVFVGGSIDDLRDFPQSARQRVGYQLHVVQQGDDPVDWKPMPAVGAGCREIRIRDANEAHRVFYVATVGDCVYVLHCFREEVPTNRQGRHRPRQATVPTNEITHRCEGSTMNNERYTSVWDAIEDTPGASENMKVRSALMHELVTYITNTGMTQSQAARQFGVTQPRISDLTRGKVDLFSIDTLVNMLTAAGLQLDLHIRAAS